MRVRARVTRIESYQAQALSELYLRWYSLSEIETLPQLAPLILTQVVQQMRQTQALLGVVGLPRVEDRLRELLQLTRLLGEFKRQGWLALDSERHIVIQN